MLPIFQWLTTLSSSLIKLPILTPVFLYSALCNWTSNLDHILSPHSSHLVSTIYLHCTTFASANPSNYIKINPFFQFDCFVLYYCFAFVVAVWSGNLDMIHWLSASQSNKCSPKSLSGSSSPTISSYLEMLSFITPFVSCPWVSPRSAGTGFSLTPQTRPWRPLSFQALIGESCGCCFTESCLLSSRDPQWTAISCLQFPQCPCQPLSWRPAEPRQ